MKFNWFVDLVHNMELCKESRPYNFGTYDEEATHCTFVIVDVPCDLSEGD